MESSTNKFWRAYANRDFATLDQFTTRRNPEIPRFCFEVAADTALLNHDIKLLQSIDFPTRAVM